MDLKIICTKCGELKSENLFRTRPLYIKKNGRHSHCKACELNYCHEWRIKNHDKWLARENKHYADNREKKKVYLAAYHKNNEAVSARKKETQKKYCTRNPEKVAAHGKVNAALRKGTLTRPDTCSKCGAKEKIQAHHKNYKFPMKVTWLCQPCHKKLHRVT